MGSPRSPNEKVTLEESVGKKYPELLKEWNPAKNKRTLYDFTEDSPSKMWWVCQKGHKWKTSIVRRALHKGKCPYCIGRLAAPDNCLATTHPEDAKQWHSTKNNKTPFEVTGGSDYRAWWICSEGHEYQITVWRKTRGKSSKCPECTGKRVTPENCLETVNPQLSKEWHPTKNGERRPEHFRAISHKKAFWLCSKNKDHEWEATIIDRAGYTQKNGVQRKGTGCPHCRPRISDPEYRLAAELQKVFPDLKMQERGLGGQNRAVDLFIPALKLVIQFDGRHYHKDRVEKDTKQSLLLRKKGYHLIRLREKGLDILSEDNIRPSCAKANINDIKILMFKIGERFSQELNDKQKEKIEEYQIQTGFWNDDLYNENKTALPGKINGTNLKEERPELAKEWHPTNNGSRLPEHYTVKSGENVWWQCLTTHQSQYTAK